MSKRLDVLLGVKAMLAAALPGWLVVGLDGSDAGADRVPTGGRATIEAGDPGPPTVDLSPPTYNYEHEIPVTLEVPPAGDPDETGERRIDGALTLIGQAIVADRFLGGLVNYLDAAAPQTSDDYVDGAAVTRIAPITIVASYSTPLPL